MIIIRMCFPRSHARVSPKAPSAQSSANSTHSLHAARSAPRRTTNRAYKSRPLSRASLNALLSRMSRSFRKRMDHEEEEEAACSL